MRWVDENELMGGCSNEENKNNDELYNLLTHDNQMQSLKQMTKQ